MPSSDFTFEHPARRGHVTVTLADRGERLSRYEFDDGRVFYGPYAISASRGWPDGDMIDFGMGRMCASLQEAIELGWLVPESEVTGPAARRRRALGR